MQFYTPQEVADMFKVQNQTVWRWIRNGKLKATQLGDGGSYRISENDLKDFRKQVS